jgi:porphobilinogen synthase
MTREHRSQPGTEPGNQSNRPLAPRRRRQSGAMRGLVRETRLTPERLVLPLFVVEGQGRREEISSLPGQCRLSVDEAAREVEAALELGIRAAVVFPKVEASRKSRDGREALREDNLVVRAVQGLRRAFPDLCIMTDVALDPYNSDGHDGVVVSRGGKGWIDNEATLPILAEMAVLHAQAGADVVAPSDMMDGRVAAIRAALDGRGFVDTMILSYTAKYASALYGPFREALDSAPVSGGDGEAGRDVPRDKKTYQMDPANAREALIEARLDEAEGADILMVKPGLAYLDIIAALRGATQLPIAAYHVSGEYAMVKAAAARGWLDERAVLTEHLLSLARAGADVIFTYAAVEYARWWREDPLGLRG